MTSDISAERQTVSREVGSGNARVGTDNLHYCSKHADVLFSVEQGHETAVMKRSKKSPSDNDVQLPRNSRPTSVGPASPPASSAPWQLTHDLTATASPRLAWSSV